MRSQHEDAQVLLRCFRAMVEETKPLSSFMRSSRRSTIQILVGLDIISEADGQRAKRLLDPSTPVEEQALIRQQLLDKLQTAASKTHRA